MYYNSIVTLEDNYLGYYCLRIDKCKLFSYTVQYIYGFFSSYNGNPDEIVCRFIIHYTHND